MPTRRGVASLGLLSIVLSFFTVLAPVGPSVAAPKPPQVSVADAGSVTEGSSSTPVFATFKVSVKKENAKKTKVSWATADGTAKAGSDYVAAKGKLKFKPGTAKQTLTIQVKLVSDVVVEPDETFSVVLSKVKNGVLKRATAKATIKNDDSAPAPKTLTVQRGGTGGGTVSSSVGAISCPSACSASYAHGTEVTLTATPDSSSDFVGWTGDCAGDADDSCTVTMTAARTVGATFDSATRALHVEPHPGGDGTGTITSAPAGINCSTCTASFAKGSDVTLTATPDAGSEFQGWAGDCSGSQPTCVLTMSANRDVTAIFVDIPDVALGLYITSPFYGQISVDPGLGSCQNDCTIPVERDTQVTLTATPTYGHVFSGWGRSCGFVVGTQTTCTLTMTEAKDAEAIFFNASSFGLQVTKGGSGKGTVTSQGPGNDSISCGPECSSDTANFFNGDVVTLTATPEPNMEFIGWTSVGDVCSGSNPQCTVSMTAGRSVQATFMPEKHQLSVTKAGTGTGTISGPVNGLNCGETTCTVDVYEGDFVNDQVTLVATPTSGTSDFAGWSGACDGTGNCTVTMDQARSVTATFTLKQRTLTVSVGGQGSVTSSPGSISCPGTCNESFAHGTSVVLTASPGAQYDFFGWSGNGCTGTSTTCTVDMTQNRSPVAQFTLKKYALSVDRNGGSGTGTVSSSPAGIACGTGGACSASYNAGTIVTLQASASQGSNFSGWTGACTGNGDCVVTMTQARSVTAVFTAQLRTITVNKTGPGASDGTVSDGDFGLMTCNATTCSGTYPYGTAVPLTAAVGSIGHFVGWSGAGCSGTDACVVTATTSQTITASFALEHNTLSVSIDGAPGTSGSVTSSPTGISCSGSPGTPDPGADCSESYSYGQQVVLTATPGSNVHFVEWSGGGCSGSGTCTVTMIEATEVVARFAIDLHTVHVTRTPSPNGWVNASGGTVLANGCDSSGVASPLCNITVQSHSIVLSPIDNSNATFVTWSGCDFVFNTNCLLTTTSDKNVTATFNNPT